MQYPRGNYGCEADGIFSAGKGTERADAEQEQKQQKPLQYPRGNYGCEADGIFSAEKGTERADAELE